jgi:DNA replicative helicase MCM subunit Mcm2 (Cdc46/Mcm family)|tara:strand:- start:410 stop:562 length:153 start_codon:yes stop_codon:yes gene_type:complete
MIQWIISKPLKALAAIKRAIALMLLGWSEKNSHQVPQLRIDSIVSWFMQR